MGDGTKIGEGFDKSRRSKVQPSSQNGKGAGHAPVPYAVYKARLNFGTRLGLATGAAISLLFPDMLRLPSYLFLLGMVVVSTVVYIWQTTPRPKPPEDG